MDFAGKLQQRILRSHVRAAEKGMTAAEYLASHYSRFDLEGWRQAIAKGMVRLNGGSISPDTVLKEHDCVAFLPGDLPEPEADLNYSILYCDTDIAVLDKSGDLCVHPTGPFFRNTLWHIAGQKLGELRFITRLDRETSGVIIACRNKKAAAAMNGALDSVRKEYTVAVFGDFPGYIRAKGMLIKDTESPVPKKKKFILESEITLYDCNGESADTEFIPLKKLPGGKTLLRAILYTGRQHQIRATLCSLGFPLVGDKLYGRDERIFLKISSRSITPEDIAMLGMERQALHASKVTFYHPFSNEELTFESPCPFGS